MSRYNYFQYLRNSCRFERSLREIRARSEIPHKMHKYCIFVVFLILVLNLSACGYVAPPAAVPQSVVQAAATPTANTTPAPTVSAPTITPGKPQSKGQSSPTATSSPTKTKKPTVEPTPTPITYAIQQGDTLFSIAMEHDVTVTELTEANDIDENDLLQIDQILIIPTSPQELNQTPVAVTSTQTITATGISSPVNSTPAYNGPPLPDITHATNVNPLTGLFVDNPAKLQRRPVLIRIGNDVGARQSQAGLNLADVVYEEIAEWWVTRFTAIFLSEAPNIVAPIRSARLINVLLAPQYNGALAHSGGSDPVRWEISQAPFVNLDEFYNPAPYFYRPNQGWQTRLAIDVEAARNYMVSKGTESAISLSGFQFADAVPSGEDAQNIYVPYPRSTSFTEWQYDPARGKYLRWIANYPLVDANDGVQISAANVIIYFAEHQDTDIVEDSNGATAIRMLINGQGRAIFFRDGKVNQGYWQTDGTRPPYFTFEDGTPYNLKPGKSWIEVVPTYYTIGINDPDGASSSP